MDFNQIEQRMKLAQRIRDTWRESRDVRDLVAILQDHTFGMTRDELEEFLMETIAPSLEQAWSERDASEQKLAEKERELEEERKAKKKAQKENEALKKALEDERNKNKTHVRNTYGSTSRRSCTAKGITASPTDRAQEKDGFDGDPDKAKASDAVAPVYTTGEGDKVISAAELKAHNARLGMTYERTQAREETPYPCNRDAIPEGWEIWDDTPVYHTLYDTKTIVTGRKVEFVRIRRKVKAINKKTGEGY